MSEKYFHRIKKIAECFVEFHVWEELDGCHSFFSAVVLLSPAQWVFRVYSAPNAQSRFYISPKRPGIICLSSRVVSQPANESVLKFSSREKSIFGISKVGGWELGVGGRRNEDVLDAHNEDGSVVGASGDRSFHPENCWKLPRNAKRSFYARPKIS